LEALIGKAFKGAAVLGYRKALITPPMGASGSPEGVKTFWQFLNSFVVTNCTRALSLLILCNLKIS